MADQQNPIQNDDLLGDIDLNIPAAPSSNDPAKDISDIGNLLVEQSIDTTQTKAEGTTIASSPAAPADPTAIDLGDINLPANEEIIAPTPAPIDDIGSLSAPETTPVSSPELPTEHMFKSEPVVETTSESIPASTELPSISEPVTEQTVVDMPTETVVDSTPISNENSIPVMESVVSETEPATPEAPSAPETIETPAIEQPEISPVTIPTTPEATPVPQMIEMPVAQPTEMNEIASISSPVESMPIELPLPVEQTDSMIDSLMNNEQTQVASMPEASPVVASMETTPDEMSFDLDSLTNDLMPKGPETASSVPANPETVPASQEGEQMPATIPADIIPAISSVTLPQATIVQPVAHGSTKKKAFAMVAAFLMLLVVG